MQLTYEHIMEARKLRQQNTPWMRIGAILGCHEDIIRRRLDPEWAAKRRDGIRRARLNRRRENRQRKLAVAEDRRARVEASARPTQEMLDAISLPVTISQVLLGDPPPGRSALDMRQRQ